MKQKVVHYLCIVLVVIGIVLTLKSVGLAENYANSVVNQHGGSMDTATYVIYLQEYSNAFRDLGLALLIIGSLCEVVGIIRSLKS